VAVPHVSEMICVKAFVGIMEQVGLNENDIIVSVMYKIHTSFVLL
jgi:hypothetical protein